MKLLPLMGWALRIGIAALFCLGAVTKLSGDAQYIAEFSKVGLGDTARIATGIFEIVAAVALLVPQTMKWGAAALLTFTFAALIVQLTILHVGWIHCVIIIACIVAIFVINKTTNAGGKINA